MFKIKVIQNYMDINLCFNNFFEKTCWAELFFIKNSCKFDRKSVCFGLLVVGASSTAPEDKIVNKSQRKKNLDFNIELHCSAKNLWIGININNDLH